MLFILYKPFGNCLGSDNFNSIQKFLISELRRYYDKFGAVPTINTMNIFTGYQIYGTYKDHFGSFKKALEISGLIDEQLPCDKFQCLRCLQIYSIEYKYDCHPYCKKCSNEISHLWYEKERNRLLYKQKRASAILHQILKQNNDKKRKLQLI